MILNAANYFLQVKLSTEAKVVNIIYVSIYLAFTTSIVMSCDGIEKSGRNVTKTCYRLQRGMSRCVLRKELLALAQFTKTLNPKFTAAGFYTINQKVLAAIFSAVTTYLIIVIQFNMTT
ncbi:hypothetical protein NQ314_021286 [Rhamnusium bicolor]|uniref:Gustatory receptor n=1 Tax=Rhamnusium bicolor TaxID=1586634 RepID=A0AAV8WIH7_9CUCU|nr:hypothetical protein NQ314_021286 [Rhamnusium bicolor]